MKTNKAAAIEVFALMLSGAILDEQRAVTLIRNKLNHEESRELGEAAAKLAKLVEDIRLAATFRQR